MNGFPVLDYAPSTLLGICVLLILLGRIVPVSAIKPYILRNDYLESALQKEQEAHAQTLKALAEAQKTDQVVQRFFNGLEQRAGS